MPLTLANIGEVNIINKIGGNEETRKHLAGLGFVTGAEVTVISSLDGNLIVSIKDCRVALGKELAKRIMI